MEEFLKTATMADIDDLDEELLENATTADIEKLGEILWRAATMARMKNLHEESLNYVHARDEESGGWHRPQSKDFAWDAAPLKQLSSPDVKRLDPVVSFIGSPGSGKASLMKTLIPRQFNSSNRSYSKAKRGLPGSANGSRISAIPDTGSTRNVASEAFVRELELNVEGSPREFKLGNSQKTHSIGELLVLVKMVRWLMDSSRHSEHRLGIFGKCYQYHDHRLRCTSSV